MSSNPKSRIYRSIHLPRRYLLVPCIFQASSVSAAPALLYNRSIATVPGRHSPDRYISTRSCTYPQILHGMHSTHISPFAAPAEYHRGRRYRFPPDPADGILHTLHIPSACYHPNIFPPARTSGMYSPIRYPSCLLPLPHNDMYDRIVPAVPSRTLSASPWCSPPQKSNILSGDFVPILILRIQAGKTTIFFSYDEIFDSYKNTKTSHFRQLYHLTIYNSKFAGRVHPAFFR